MNKNNTWQRVSKRRPCAVCKKPSWCLFAGPDDDPTAAICARVESPKRAGEAGWLHVLRDDGNWRPTRRRVVQREVAEPAPDGHLAAEAERTARWCDEHPEALGLFAGALGLSIDSLRRLRVGWSARRQAWLFPMRNASGQVLGIRLRLLSGRKLSVRGGREGLFLPSGIEPGGRVLVCEGPTDTAALLDLGFSAIGRPSCMGGVRLLVELVRQQQPSEVVIVADRDGPGQRGADRLASVLAAYCRAVRIITPPAGKKDVREWKRSGASAADVQQAIEAVPIRRLAVHVRRKRKRNAI